MKKTRETNEETQQSEPSETSSRKILNDKAAIGESYASAREMVIPEIVIDDTINVRSDSIDRATVDSYAENFDNLPPLSVFTVDDKHYLVDGWHRFFAARKLNRTAVRVVIVGSGSLDDARDFADKANLGHGLPLTRWQRKEVARRLHARHPGFSHRKLGQMMGCSHPTIAAWLTDEARQHGKNFPPTKADMAYVPPLEEPAPAIEPMLPTEDGAAQVGLSTKHKDAVAPSPVNQSPAVVDDEMVSFVEQTFIQLSSLDAKRGGQPLSQIARKKLHGLLDLISEILGTKEVGQ